MPELPDPDPATDHGAARADRVLTIEQALRRAAVLCDNADNEAAIGIYDQILAIAPDTIAAHHQRGIAQAACGRAGAALASFDQVIARAPTHLEALINRGVMLTALARPDAAIASLDRALALAPGQPEAHYNRGNVFSARGAFAAALASYDSAIALAPAHALAYNNRGVVLTALGRHAQAVTSFEQAIVLSPQHAGAFNNLGATLRQLGRLDAALANFDRAIALAPDYADAHNNRGIALAAAGDHAAALSSFARAIELNPNDVNPHNNRANALAASGRLDEALAAYSQAIALAPTHAESCDNRGNLWRRMHLLQAALRDHDRAITLAPGLASAHTDRAITLGMLEQFDAAQASFARALALAPADPSAHFNLGLTCLALGDFARGWDEYEWRWQDPRTGDQRRHFSQPLWQGQSDLRGRTILLHAEQGLGDTLQFCRYAEWVAARGATVVLEVPAALLALLAGLPAIASIVARGAPLPPFDLHCPLLSLPRAFATDLSNLPASTPYLSADLERVARWRRRLGEPRQLRIGLVWSGSATHEDDGQRSLPLAALLPLLDAVRADWVSLQIELRADDAALLATRTDVRDCGSALTDFAETAAVVELLDLVITVDTSVAHLAGALGKPVWILLPFRADWRWLRGRPDSPWYPSARLFRQPARQDWGSVVARVCEELLALPAGQPPPPGSATAIAADAARHARDTCAFEQAAAAWLRNDWTECGRLCRRVLAGRAHAQGALALAGAAAARVGRTQDAADLLRRALELDPSPIEVHSNLAHVLHLLGDHAGALAGWEQVIARVPALATPYNERGVVLVACGRVPEALSSFDAAIALDAEFADAYSNRGVALTRLGRHEDARASCEHALALHPEHADAHNNLGNILRELQRHEQALAHCLRAIALQPEAANAHNSCGIVLADLGRCAEAVSAYERALAIQPDYIDAHYNCGVALRKMNLYEAALACFERAIQIDPTRANAHNGCAMCAADLRDYARARAHYAHAIALEPNYASAHLNLALCLLRLGEFARGWQEYEWRWQDEQVTRFRRDFTQPQWTGSAELTGSTILLHGEQGLGDSLQFCRYTTLVAARGATVVLEVEKPLLPVLAGLAGVTRLVAKGEATGAFDWHCPLLSLPAACTTELDNIPAAVPYLYSDPARVERWRQRLGPPTRPRIGVMWSGNPAHSNDANRSLALAALLPVLGDWAEWISVQKEIRGGDAELLRTHGQVRDFASALTDFAETAALLELLDLVVTIDSSVAHLAGAMGKVVWILLPYNADWRWLNGRNDSPWYPSARLFRQPARLDWASVLAQVGAELARFAT